LYWTSGSSRHEREVLEFLRRWEWKNLSLSRHHRELRESRLGLFTSSPLQVGRLVPEETQQPAALLYQKDGVVLPLLAEGVSPAALEEAPLSSGIRMIMGSSLEVETLENQVRRPLRQRIVYDLMVHLGEPAAPVSPAADILVKTASPADTDSLSLLQRGYELEEVLLEDSIFDIRLCLQNLKSLLKRETVLVAYHKGLPVAKAGTNARGYGFSQVGGVYTLPEYRGRGISRYLMALLARREWDQGRALALFVKKTNLPARALYHRGGFKRMGDFRITYYR